jgi:MoaA/NifB/PqqE/SkfB family radical SAM enzyme
MEMFAAQIKDAFRLLKTLWPGRVWNYVLILHARAFTRIFARPLFFGMPVFLSVEPTNRCNLQCPECPTGLNLLTREKGMMSLELFQRIIESARATAMYLNLYFQGEPLLHPRLFEMIDIAKRAGIYVSTSTNAQLIDRPLAEKLIASGLDRLIISFDGPDEESYVSYRKGGEWSGLLQAVAYLVAAKKERDGKGPFIVLQCLWLSTNVNKKAALIRLTQELGADKLEFKTLQLLDPSKPSTLVPASGTQTRYQKCGDAYVLKRTRSRICSRLFTTLVITHDGKTAACCYDKNAEVSYGDLHESSIRELWNGTARKEFVRNATVGRSAIKMCACCEE